MDDGFVLWPKNANINVFREILNELYPSLKFTVEKGKSNSEQTIDTFVQVLNFLDISIILHQNGWLETEIFYKETNLNDYLNHFSHLLEHRKQNISYNLATRMIIFVSDKPKINERLSQLKTWLLLCGYPVAAIEKFFLMLHCRQLRLKKKRCLFHLYQHNITTLIRKNIPITAYSLWSDVKDNKLKKVFEKYKVIHTLKQPEILLSMLTILKVQNRNRMVCIAVNKKIPAVIYVHHICKNVQVS